MIIRQINDRAVWNSFIVHLPQYTFLHSWEWGQVQKKMGEDVEYLGFFEGAQQRGAALLLGVKAQRGSHWLCPHGPLVTYKKDLSSVVTSLIGYVRQHPVARVALRVAPLLINTAEHQQLLTSYGFRRAPIHVHAELTWMLDLASDEPVLLRGMRKTTRHAIRNAQMAGVTTTVSNDIGGLDRFLPLYDQTRQRHGFVPFSRAMLATQLEIFCPMNQAFTVIVSYQGRDIAAGIFIHFGDTVYYYHGASLSDLRVPGPHFVQWQAIREAKQRGATHFNFWGIAPASQPRHPFAGITIFKKGFGGYAMDLLPAHDLPLSWKYVTLWAVDSWRKWRRGF